MTCILVSQRVDIISDYGERRDALDQRWAAFMQAIGCVGLPVPNHVGTLRALLNEYEPDGILLTGGNNPAKYQGNAPERDAVDDLLLEYAVNRRIPLIGVCRGMQSIVLYFGGTLRTITDHVAVRHSIVGETKRNVNSYHTLAVEMLPAHISVTEQTEDRCIEAIKLDALPIWGIMWHPERESPFHMDDIHFFQKIWIER